MSPSVKILLGATVVTAAIGYLAFLGAANSWQYYMSVDEAAEDAARLLGKRVRVSGRVSSGSLSIGEDRRRATFELAGQRHALSVSAVCWLPDNFAEDIDVVVEGTLAAGGIQGDKVITRCASKYQAMNEASQ